MSKNCAFTICTKSYIGLALVLKESIYKYYSDLDFYIFVADEIPAGFELPEKTFGIKDLNIFDEQKWYEMAFKYNVTEFCTCLKPFMFKWLFENSDAEKICYMDPDLYFFDNAEVIYKNLDNCLIELTPHFCTFPENEYSKHFEDEVRFSGIYNLGFLGLKRHEKSFRLLDWWGNNLTEKCFNDALSFQFTDQKWMDFVTLLFDLKEINIIRDLGWNVAPWNYFERKTVLLDNNYIIEDRNDEKNRTKLLFCHFSGFDYKKLLQGSVIQKNKGHDNVFPDADITLNVYIQVLSEKKEKLLSYFLLPYSYNTFSDGKTIERIHRKIYKSILMNNFENLSNPFESSGEFYKTIKRMHIYQEDAKGQIVEILKENDDYVKNRLKKVNRIMRLLHYVLGHKRYIILIRFLLRFSKFENQAFLYNKDYLSWV